MKPNEKRGFCRTFQDVIEKNEFFQSLNQIVTKKIELIKKKIWSVQKKVVSLHHRNKKE